MTIIDNKLINSLLPQLLPDLVGIVGDYLDEADIFELGLNNITLQQHIKHKLCQNETFETYDIRCRIHSILTEQNLEPLELQLDEINIRSYIEKYWLLNMLITCVDYRFCGNIRNKNIMTIEFMRFLTMLFMIISQIIRDKPNCSLETLIDDAIKALYDYKTINGELSEF